MNIFKQPTAKYEYLFPRDTEKAIVDAIALGSLKAIKMFSPEISLARDEVEKLAHTGCSNLKKMTKAHKLTNDYTQLDSLYNRYFTDAFLLFQATFIEHPEQHELMFTTAETSGWDVAYLVLHRNIQRTHNAKAGEQGASNGI